jgi:hypothetical protein
MSEAERFGLSSHENQKETCDEQTRTVLQRDTSERTCHILEEELSNHTTPDLRQKGEIICEQEHAEPYPSMRRDRLRFLSNDNITRLILLGKTGHGM